MKPLTKAKINVQTPNDFDASCELFGIEPAELLWCFIKNVSVFSHTSKTSTGLPGDAAIIFDEFLKSREPIHLDLVHVEEDISISYLNQIVELVASPLEHLEKMEAYNQLISEWYEQINNE